MDVILKKTDYEHIDEAIKFIFENTNLVFHKNDKVVIKTNGVGAFPKESGICTHPEIIKSVIKYLENLNLDLNIYIGDNPATKDINVVYRVNGTFEAIKNTTAKLINPLDKTIIETNNFTLYEKFEVSKDFIDCDVLINIAKLKTHGFAYYSGAVKNYFGLIYGLEKANWHVKASDPYQFFSTICDLYQAFLEARKDKITFNIIDGVLSLEGEGPSASGIPVYLNAVIASIDAVSADRVALEIGNLEYEKSFITTFANERNLGIGEIEKINIIGDKISDFQIKMKEPMKAFNNRALNILRKFKVKKFILEHPKFASKCILCKECMKICPPKAINFKNNKMHVNTSKCIRCWCCMEVCPISAISKSKRPLLGRIILKSIK